MKNTQERGSGRGKREGVRVLRERWEERRRENLKEKFGKRGKRSVEKNGLDGVRKTGESSGRPIIEPWALFLSSN